MRVNGEWVPLETPSSLTDFLQKHGYSISRIAVEHNGEIVPKASFSDVILSEDDVLEIVSFMGGG